MKKMKIILKRICFVCSFVFLICFAAGCGNNEPEEELKSIEDRAIDFKEDASSAVDETNEDTKELEKVGKSLEQD